VGCHAGRRTGRCRAGGVGHARRGRTGTWASRRPSVAVRGGRREAQAAP